MEHNYPLARIIPKGGSHTSIGDQGEILGIIARQEFMTQEGNPGQAASHGLKWVNV